MPTRKVLIRILLVGLVATGTGALGSERDLNYGINHYRMGLHGHAIPALLRTADEMRKVNDPDQRLPLVLAALGDMAESDNRMDLAKDFYARAAECVPTRAVSDLAQFRQVLREAGTILQRRGQVEAAIVLYGKALEYSDADPSTPARAHAIDLDNLGTVLAAAKRTDEALALSKRALKLIETEANSPQTKITRAVILYNMAYANAEVGRSDAAGPLFKDSLSLLEDLEGTKSPELWRLRLVQKQYAVFLRRTGLHEEATKYEQKAAQIAR